MPSQQAFILRKVASGSNVADLNSLQDIYSHKSKVFTYLSKSADFFHIYLGEYEYVYIFRRLAVKNEKVQCYLHICTSLADRTKKS